MKRKALVVTLLVVSVILPFRASADVTVKEGFLPSWDKTKIAYTLFLPDAASETNPVPIVLRTHGWGGTRDRSVGGLVKKLLDSGYAVLTWDSRGFGDSGGQVEIDHPGVEGKDVSALIDFAAAQPEILSRTQQTSKASGMPDAERSRLPELVRGRFSSTPDPVVGMTGGSYAGGIQLMAASIDSRIDAIAPEIAWHDLPRSIFPNGVPKFGWDTLLYGAGQTALVNGLDNGETGNYNPEIHRSYVQVSATNDPSAFNDFYDERSPRRYIDAITAPTLVIQGTIDTLFTITEGVNNFNQIGDNVRSDGTTVPVKLLLYNSGHTLGSSVSSGNAREKADASILSWFDKYMKRVEVDTGPLVEYQDNTPAWHASEVWPVSEPTVVKGSAANLVVTPAPSGGGDIAKGNPNFNEASARIPILTADSDGTMLIGVPHLSGTVSGIGEGAFLFFKLVDADTNQVLDDQVTALSVKLLSGPVQFDIQLEGLSWLLPGGHELVLEVSTGSMMYSNYRGAAFIDDLDVELSVPVGSPPPSES
jgi:ABC-2 type transport system ATP-binding protein